MPDAQLAQVAACDTAAAGRTKDAVLLLEDNEAIARMLAAILQRVGLRVIWCPTGRDGLREFELHQQDIALVITDCGLPDGDGRVVCQQMRHTAAWLPVLVTSGRMRADNLAPLASAPSVRFLAKPYAPSEILGHVRTLLSAVRAAPAPVPAGFV